MANQEPENPSSCSYDVFLSFKGDTRYSFTGFLYNELTRKGVKTFMDDECLEGGDVISEALVNAIRQSRISIVVFSENFSCSKWCLDELVVIVECMRSEKKQLVWPIFYKVNPSDVRHHRNNYSMVEHENRLGEKSEVVQNWKSALFQVANLKGWNYQTGRYEYELIEEIVKRATTKLEKSLQVVKHKPLKVGPWGGPGGGEWDDGYHDGVREIILEENVHNFLSFTVVYDKQGSIFETPKRGDHQEYLGRVISIKLDYPREYLIGVSGSYALQEDGSLEYVRSLKFTSNLKTYGAYADREDRFRVPFASTNETQEIVGFYGRSGFFLDQIGIYVRHRPAEIK